MTQMRRMIPVVAVLLGLAGTLFAADVVCPLHTYAPCYSTGQVASTGSGAVKWHCSCGDDVWVAPESPAQPPPPPPPQSPVQSPSDAFKQGQEMGRAIGAPIGLIIAQNRARHAEEKRDLTLVVYCRQNPTANITPNQKQISCIDFSNYTVAYCTVHEREKLCKDVAKLPSQSQTPVAAAKPQVQVQPQQIPQQMAAPGTEHIHPATQREAQPQAQTQPGAESEAEVSVAEAARRNREAKAKAAAEEKAKENPPQR
jgi:hypothetical protein